MVLESNKIYCGPSLKILKSFPDESINCVVTSPPYWGLRDYGVEGQLGLEESFQEYIMRLCDIFEEIKRVLTKDGTCWVNLGDTYASSGGASRHLGYNDPKYKNGRNGQHIEPHAYPQKGIKPKSLCLIPERFAIEMCNRGWILRNTIIWHKPNAMPSSVKDRFTVDFEKLFFFSKSKRYYFNQQFEPHKTKENRPMGIVREREFGYDTNYPEVRGFKTKKNVKQPQPPQRHDQNINYHPKGRNMRTTWSQPTKAFKGAHFAVYPEELIETPIKSGCPVGGIILDPFFGSGTTGVVALKQNKKFIGIELNKEYIKIAEKRLEPFLNQRRLESYLEER